MSSFIAALLIGVVGTIVLVTGYLIVHGINSNYIISDLYANFGAEFISIALTVLVIDYLNLRRQERDLKQQLIRDLGSENNLFTHRAIRELRANGKKDGGWLSDGTLSGASLLGANLLEAPLQGAVLENTDLTGANLECAFLTDTNLNGSILRYANLNDANLEDSVLTNVDFRGASLRKANLNGANLRDSDLSEAIIIGISYDANTKWPDGFQIND